MLFRLGRGRRSVKYLTFSWGLVSKSYSALVVGVMSNCCRFGENKNHVIVGPMFRRIPIHTLPSCFQGSLNNTLKHLCYSGYLKEAIALLYRSQLVMPWPTYALLLQECIHVGAFHLGLLLHSHLVVVGFTLNQYLNIKLLIFYSKAGKLGTACFFFHHLLNKALISWNAMIAGYVQKGMEHVGLNLYHNMRLSGMTPDQYTFASVFRACASLAMLQDGKQAHAVMLKCKIGENVVVNSALMDMYFKCSCTSDGHLVFNKSPYKNVITWTSLISGYGHNGKASEVLELFDKLIQQGLRSNYVTFLAVLSACSHKGLVDDGWKYFLSMNNDYGIQPREKHYAAMIDLLGRAGRLEEAYNFISSSPCKENPVVWGSLLGACRLHGNMKMLKLSAKNYFELEPENAGKYVVLSNTFASFAMWENVAEVWSSMRDFGMKKDPAYSRIEVQNEVHFFFMGDNMHKGANGTYAMLKVLTCVMMDSDSILDMDFES